MNLNQLRVFARVADAGSLTAAAHELGVSQPAVTKQLAELEESVGMNLFDRLPRGVRLTAAGSLLVRRARKIFAEEQAAEGELAQLVGVEGGQLCVGASTTIGNYLMPQWFGRFHGEYPGVRLELLIENTAMIQQAVIDGRLDFGLTEGLSRSDALDVEVVGHDEMAVIAAPSHSVLRRKKLRASNLQDYPILMRERGSGTRDVIEAELRRKDIHVEVAMELGSSEALKNAVVAGLGIAIVSRLTVELDLEHGRLQEVSIKDFRLRRALHLLQLKGKRASPASEAFLRLVRTASEG